MEVKLLINALIIILIIYIILDNIPVRYRIGVEKRNVYNNPVQEQFNSQIDKPFISQTQSLDFLKSTEIEDKDLKNILSNNDESIKPSNFWLSNDSTPNYGSNVTNVSDYYEINKTFDGIEKDNLVETNYNSIDKERKIMEDTIIDTQTQQSSFLDTHTNDNQHTLKPDTWSYKNELPMNGGLFNGISGFDSMNDSLAVYDANDLNIEKCDNGECSPIDDLRNGVGKPGNESRYMN